MLFAILIYIMNFTSLLDSVKNSLFPEPSIVGNLVHNRQWNQDLPRYGGVAPGNQMVQNPNVASPLQAPDEITPGLEAQGQFDRAIASRPPQTFEDVQGMQRQAPIPPGPTVTPPPHKNALPYYEDINAAAAENDVPQDLFYNMLHAESNFDPDVVYGRRTSSVGAQGIGQFMPSTSAGMGFDPLNPKEAIPAAAKYIRAKYDEGGDDWRLALARYNAGSGNVNKYGGIPPFPETQRYVKKIMGE